MARRGENIYHRKDGRWEGRYIIGRKLDGKPKFRSIYGETYSEVKQRLVVLKSKQLQENDRQPVLLYGNGTLSDWMDYWLNVLEKPYIKPTTYQLYKRNIEKHLRPFLGRQVLAWLKKEEIQEAVDQLKEKLAPNTLHSICRQLKCILNTAVKNGLIARSPYEDIRLPKFRQRAPRVLTTAEQIHLEQSIAGSAEDVEYLLCLYTGLRLGELCALRYRDLDFRSNHLRVTHSVKRVACDERGKTATKLVVGDTKTDSSAREIPVPIFLMEMLRQRMAQNHASGEDFIFQNKAGGAAEPRTIQARFARLMKKLDIQGAHMHTLRHTFAMRCLERGMGYKALSEILGHSSSEMTIRHYDNCTRESKDQMIHAVRMIA